MKLEVNIEKRHAFAIIILLAGVIAIVSVVAYGTSNPPVFGHSVGELDGFPNCEVNEYLWQSNGNWDCRLDDVGGGTLEVDTRSNNGAGSTVDVSCLNGWLRTGCSGGNVQATDNYNIAPFNGNLGCRITGVVGHSKNIYAYCTRIVP